MNRHYVVIAINSKASISINYQVYRKGAVSHRADCSDKNKNLELKFMCMVQYPVFRDN